MKTFALLFALLASFIATNGEATAATLAETTQLAEQGAAEAQATLGEAYRKGRGVKRDYGAAAKWYERAATQGHARAQYRLAALYRKGRGVAKDQAQAAKWYKRAALGGYAKAQFALGALYGGGRLVVQDNAKAYMWMHIAQTNGDTRAITSTAKNFIAARLSARAIAAAEKQAQSCIASDYKDC